MDNVKVVTLQLNRHHLEGHPGFVVSEVEQPVVLLAPGQWHTKPQASMPR